MRVSIFIICLLLFPPAFGQINLKILATDSSSANLATKLNREFTNENEALNALESHIGELISKGYLTASIDTWRCDTNTCNAHIFVGDQYQWGYLGPGNIDEYVLSSIGYRDKIYRNKPLQPRQITELFDRIISHYENLGFPFASIKLDSIKSEDSKIYAQLNITKNQLVIVDSIRIEGTSKITPVYLHNYLNIRPGSLYNEENILNISTRVKELPFVKESNSPEITFTKEYTKLSLYLEDKKASKFDGVLGILPNQNSNAILFTGDVKLLLLNAIGRGEFINLNWRKLQNQTTDLKVATAYPFIANLPFGVEGQFMLYRRDTTFQDIEGLAGIQYLLPRGNYFKVFASQKQSRLLSTTGMENITSLPQQIDVNNTTYGIGLKAEKLDYKYNPTKGYEARIEGGAGTRQIIKNATLPEKIYENVKPNSLQINSTASLAYYIPLLKQATLKLAAKGAYRYTDQLFKNELFRIGGLRTLRGFDEESINASNYTIGTIEFRYLLEQNSYTYLFIDGGYYENNSIEGFQADFPFGFGAGISFETKAGIFSLNYALGYQQQELAPLRSAKIHFGFVNFF